MKIYFFPVNTKNISSHVLYISEILLMLRTHEFTDIFSTFDEIYLVFTSKSKYPLIHLQLFVHYVRFNKLCVYLFNTLQIFDS